MAFSVAKLFSITDLTATNATIYTVPSSPTTTILTGAVFRLTNVTAGAITVNMHIIDSGGSADTTNYNDALLKDYSVSANSTVEISIPQMSAGDFIQMLASAANSVNVAPVSGTLFS
jgi:basic membrane lipoprotein Med (substrate-binding protein (PBP1-ABC) superfamily)